MITFKNIQNEEPLVNFHRIYRDAEANHQKNIEAMCISSYSNEDQLVDSRYVNLKYIDGLNWTFYSNYQSPKSKQFVSHNQVSVIFYWNTIDTQIRLRAHIKKSPTYESDEHFRIRSKEKKALAVSSSQSEIIRSYDEVIANYKKVLDDDELLKKRPKYWGGYTFSPFYFEFWKGHESRLNQRKVYLYENGKWKTTCLQP